ncbi:LOW QUALITY PROTEIN: interferon-induced GTP-binding protein Mx-like [Podargus strigoides]
MDTRSVAFNQLSERTKYVLKKYSFASPSLQSGSECFEVPLPLDLEDEGLLMSKDMIKTMPNYEQELKKEYDEEQDKQAAEHTLSNQYEEKIRPCMDLINNLRALGVERDLSLPAIAVIGDQSSRKSSVLEALSGVPLPRGTGIVTRCPLELKLERIPATQAWKGKICYRNISMELQNASEVEKVIREAQDVLAGTRGAISGELISLGIWSPDVPDLTLIDRPGIARVAMGAQTKDIGEQIKMLLKKIIGCKETLNLVVVPCNVDIATTEALRMAQEVDPSGERTLGILTKPDLVDRGTEESILHIVRNLVIPLRKGCMIVKCRGQQDIRDKLALATAIQQERKFFETKHFSILLEEGRATIPHLAEKLTNELVRHILKTLQTLENQIRQMLQKTFEDLQKYKRGTPRTESEQLIFLTDLIKLFNQDISQRMHGEEQLFGNEKVYHDPIPLMFALESSYGTCARLSALVLVEENFMELTERHFDNFQNLNRAAKTRVETIRRKQAVEAERHIRTQFKMERIVYFDDIYIYDLKSVKAENTTKVGNGEELQLGLVSKQDLSFSQEMVSHMKAYFSGATKHLSNQIPLIILTSALHDFRDNLQTSMLHLLQEKESHLLHEDREVARHRIYLCQQVDCLTKACELLRDFTLA